MMMLCFSRHCNEEIPPPGFSTDEDNDEAEQILARLKVCRQLDKLDQPPPVVREG